MFNGLLELGVPLLVHTPVEQTRAKALVMKGVGQAHGTTALNPWLVCAPDRGEAGSDPKPRSAHGGEVAEALVAVPAVLVPPVWPDQTWQISTAHVCLLPTPKALWAWRGLIDSRMRSMPHRWEGSEQRMLWRELKKAARPMELAERTLSG